MKSLLGCIALGVCASGSALAQLIDFEDTDPSLISAVGGPSACIADVFFETQGFAVQAPGLCTSVFEAGSSGSSNLVLYTSQTSLAVPAVVNLYSLDNSRFDLQSFDLVRGASDRVGIAGYRDNELVYVDNLRVTTGFLERQELDWVDVDFVRFTASTFFGIPNAIGLANLLVESANTPRDRILSIVNSPSAVEGAPLEFTVRLSVPSQEDVTFDIETINGTAVAPDDYVAEQSSRVLAAGQTELTILVPTSDDAIEEDDEELSLRLSNPTNAQFVAGDPYAVGTIVDNDDSTTPPVTTPILAIVNAPAAKEGDFLKFRITLSESVAETVTFEVNTIDDTTTAGDDYRARFGERQFAPGQTQLTIWVPTFDDDAIELNEKLSLRLSNPVNAQLAEGGGAEAVGIIVDNDDDSKKARLSVADGSGTEGDFARFDLMLAEPADEDVRVLVRTVSGSATENQDFQQKRGGRIIPAGRTRITIWVPLVNDGQAEGDETFELHVTAQSANVMLADDGVGVGAISDR